VTIPSRERDTTTTPLCQPSILRRPACKFSADYALDKSALSPNLSLSSFKDDQGRLRTCHANPPLRSPCVSPYSAALRQYHNQALPVTVRIEKPIVRGRLRCGPDETRVEPTSFRPFVVEGGGRRNSTSSGSRPQCTAPGPIRSFLLLLSMKFGRLQSVTREDLGRLLLLPPPATQRRSLSRAARPPRKFLRRSLMGAGD